MDPIFQAKQLTTEKILKNFSVSKFFWKHPLVLSIATGTGHFMRNPVSLCCSVSEGLNSSHTEKFGLLFHYIDI